MFTIPSSVKDLTVSFSGAETCAQRLMKQGIRKEDIATAVYNCIIKTLEKWILNAIKVYQLKDILLVGGVASSRILRHELIKRLGQRDSDIKLYFADPVLSRDNAVGTALLGLKIYKHDAV